MSMAKLQSSSEEFESNDSKPSENLFPKPHEIVRELDKYIIGQDAAKRSLAIALRNRWRRQQLPEDFRDEVGPKNIILIGPTGVGKTEIARRLSKLARSPFLKVEASKFTEVGYVGRDVESMIRDLTEIAKSLVKGELEKEIEGKAKQAAEERLLDLLLPPPPPSPSFAKNQVTEDPIEQMDDLGKEQYQRTREKFRTYLREGKMEEREVEIEVADKMVPSIEVISNSGVEDMDINFRDILGNLMPPKKRRRKVKVPEALQILQQEEAGKLIDMDTVIREALNRVEQSGIIFLDEIDKIAGRDSRHGPDVSREGVQRDLLPIIEGSTVNTKYGIVNTDHILFIAAGAFHVAKPSDLIPELQGRFPIRVELDSLNQADFVRILTEPKNALVRQYTELLRTEGVELEFTEDAIRKIAELAEMVNRNTENIGARRLHTIMERLLDEISFDAPDQAEKTYAIDKRYVEDKLKEFIANEDLSRYIL